MIKVVQKITKELEQKKVRMYAQVEKLNEEIQRIEDLEDGERDIEYHSGATIHISGSDGEDTYAEFWGDGDDIESNVEMAIATRLAEQVANGDREELPDVNEMDALVEKASNYIKDLLKVY